MRTPSFLCSRLKETSFSSVAEYSLIGMETIPKLIAPFQIDRGMLLAPVTYARARPAAAAMSCQPQLRRRRRALSIGKLSRRTPPGIPQDGARAPSPAQGSGSGIRRNIRDSVGEPGIPRMERGRPRPHKAAAQVSAAIFVTRWVSQESPGWSAGALARTRQRL